MQYVNLGRTGLVVSRICLGMMTYGSKQWRQWVLEEHEALPFIEKAWRSGVNFFDTADVYSNGVSEEILGRAVRSIGIAREQVVIATKLNGPMGESPNQRGLSRKHIRHAIDNSLKRLNMDYIDLYQIHRFDPHAPIDETIDGLDDVVKAGKALYIGASSMDAWQFADYLHTARRLNKTRFVSMQNHYNLIYREEEREMLPLCRHEEIAVIPWSPLARGFLAGNRNRSDKGQTDRAKTDDFAHKLYYQPADFAVVDRLTQIAKSRSVSNAQIALAWILHQPGVTSPIIGASKLLHLDEAIAAVDIKLTVDELSALAEPYVPHRVLGHG
jgi:aryl-alcohol dehydrogenase-like predicted oxidoreductase